MTTIQPQAPRASTGITGLDRILGGGFPAQRLYLVQGSPGSGKTTLALQFLLEGVRRGEPCLYVSLSETAEEVVAVARAHGWPLDGLPIYEGGADGVGESENTLFEPSEVELGERMRGILGEVERLQPTRVVLDSCTELRLLAQSALRYRQQVLALKHELVERSRTVLLIDNPSPSAPDVLLQSIVHGVITLDQLLPLYGAERRRLRIAKLRGIPYAGGYHDFVIRTGGLRVFPRLVAAEHAGTPETEPIGSGVPELDELLGGGPVRGTSTLLIGPSGSGKSSLASVYAVAAAARGEQVAIFAFDETEHTTFARARSLGIDLHRHVEGGRIELRRVDPAELSPGEFADAVCRSVDDGVRVVIIDSLNGYQQAMPEERLINVHLHELLTYLGTKGVATFLLVAQHGLVGQDLEAPTDVSYLADNVVLFRFFEARGGVRKAISVMKRRTGPHENTIRELMLGSNGVHLGPVLTEFRGVLTGVPVIEPAAPSA
jgi:circadian clock protein KaiC